MPPEVLHLVDSTVFQYFGHSFEREMWTYFSRELQVRDMPAFLVFSATLTFSLPWADIPFPILSDSLLYFILVPSWTLVSNCLCYLFLSNGTNCSSCYLQLPHLPLFHLTLNCNRSLPWFSFSSINKSFCNGQLHPGIPFLVGDSWAVWLFSYPIPFCISLPPHTALLSVAVFTFKCCEITLHEKNEIPIHR